MNCVQHQRKIKRVNTKRSFGKRLNGVKLPSTHMDVSYADDSNDSGLGIEVSRMPNNHTSRIVEDCSDRSSTDRDSSDDSVDSGIFEFSGTEDHSSLFQSVAQEDTSGRVMEESGLASLLCQAVNLGDDIERFEKGFEDFSEPPAKRPYHMPCNKNTGNELQCESQEIPNLDKANTAYGHINCLGIAPQSDPPRLQSDKASGGSSSSSSGSGSHCHRRKINRKQPSLHISYPGRSKDGQVELRILSQPEEQHRARYMTEGSRGAVKDRKGTGFPTVKLVGFEGPVTLQVFIGTDQGKVQPHLFYQACKVSGKNCTPCDETVLDGTAVIEIAMLPEKDMTVSCDCIGILKERNVDVEQRLPYFSITRAKKKNTRCRMVFRVNLPSGENTTETLQAASSPILCTQPPGVPEICKKSIKECSVLGGVELFMIGKNFLKDTKIIFQETTRDGNETLVWQDVVDPEKEFLHQTHLVCKVPPYASQNIMDTVKVHLLVQSGGKTSEAHTFTYLPVNSGLTINNLGNYQNMSQTGSDPGLRTMPTSFIQVPSTNGMIPLAMSQPTRNVISSKGNSMTTTTTSHQPLMMSPAQKGPKFSAKMSSFAVQQGDRLVRKQIASPSLTHGKQRAMAARRWNPKLGYSKGKNQLLMRSDMRNRLSPARHLQFVNSRIHHQNSTGVLLTTLKQEIESEIQDEAVFTTSPTAVEMGDQHLFVSPVSQVSPESSDSVFSSETLTPLSVAVTAIDQTMYSPPNESVAGIALNQPQVVNSLCLDGPCMPVTTADGVPTNQAELLVGMGSQPLASPGEMLQQHQQAEMVQFQQSELQRVMSENSIMSDSPATTLANELIQTRIQHNTNTMSNSPPVHQPLLSSGVHENMVLKQLSSESLCSTIEQETLATAESIGQAMTSPKLASDTLFPQSQLELSVSNFPQENQSPPTCQIQLSDATEKMLQENCMMEQERRSSLVAAIKEELITATSTPTCPSDIALNSHSQQCGSNCTIMPTCLTTLTNVAVDQHQLPITTNSVLQNMQVVKSVGGSEFVTVEPPNPGSNELQVTSSSGITYRIEMVATPISSTTDIRPSNLVQVTTAPGAVSTAPSQTTVPTTTGTTRAPGQDNPGLQQCMTTLSQLSEADLLSFINPSTFDNM